MAVRRESVVLDLDDRLTPGLVRAAAAAGLLNRELKNLGGGTGGASQGINTTERDVARLGNTAGGSSREIDRLSGRLSILATAAVDVGPAFVGIGAVGVQAIAGLGVELGAVALGAGTAVLAFHGVGTALTAVNKAALDPTVTNLNAAQLALDGLPPAAAAFTRELSAMQPQLKAAQNAAGAGLFPGLSQALGDLQHAVPQVNRVLNEMGQTLGNLAAEGAASLTGPEWADFRNFIEQEAPVALNAFAHSLGSVLHGIGELIVATTPLQHNFAAGLLDASAAFDQWASSVGKTQGFQDFMAFIEQSGPQVGAALAAIGNAILGIAEAAAPLSGPVLGALTAVLNVIAQIGQSKIGTPIYATIVALMTLSRAQSAFGKLSQTSWMQALRGAETYSAKVAAIRGPAIRGGLALAGLGLAASGVADDMGLANTATGVLTGALSGDWGAAAGGAVGLMLDLSKSSAQYEVNTAELTGTLNQQTGALTKNTAAYVENQLQQQGVLTAARSLGLNLTDVTRAALGNADAYARVAAAARDLGQLDDAGGEALIKIKGALDTSSAAVKDAQSNVVQLGVVLHGMSGNFGDATSAIESFRQALDRANETLSKRASLRDYQAALDAFTKSVKDNGRSLDINTSKGRNNQAALDAIAESALKVAQGMRGTNREHFLTQARADFVDAARKLGLSTAQAQALADKLGLLNQITAKPRIDLAGGDTALAQARAVDAAIRAITSKTVTLTVNRVTGGRSVVAPGQADGGTVPGVRYPYADKVYAILAPGEEVITNRHGEADQFRADRASGRIPHYAAGGTIGGVGGVGGPNDASKGDRAMRGLQHSIDALTKSVDADKQSRDDLRQKSQQLSQQVSGSFQSDLFAQTGVWGAGSSPNGILRSDIHDARAFRRALKQAHRKGLSGGAFQALAESGNLQAAQFEAGQTRAQLKMTDRLFNQRRHAAGAAGAYAATVRYGQQLADIQHTLHREHAELVRLRHEAARHAKQAKQNAKDNAHDTSKAINGAGANATRRARHR